jgi:hypothetical protein
MIYPSKKDWYIHLLFPGVGLAGCALGSVLISEGINRPAAQVLLVAGCAPILIGILLLWIYAATSSEISPTELIVRSGPVRWPIPLDSIAEIRCLRGRSGEPGWKFALSTDMVFLRYRKPDGRPAAFGVAISPEDKAGFLLELRQAVPGLKVIGDDGELA